VPSRERQGALAGLTFGSRVPLPGNEVQPASFSAAEATMLLFARLPPLAATPEFSSCGRCHAQAVSPSLARAMPGSGSLGLFVPLRGGGSLRPVGLIWRGRGGLGRLRAFHRLHRQALVVPAAIPGSAGGHPGNGRGSDSGRWTTGRVA